MGLDPMKPQMHAGCLFRKDGYKRWPFPYGGFGTVLTRGSIKRLLHPIYCNKHSTDAFTQGVCQSLARNGIGEQPLFREGMSVSDLFHDYSAIKMFCFHSDWITGYMARYYLLSEADELVNDQDESKMYSMAIWPQKCGNWTHLCTVHSGVCHRQGPKAMEYLALMSFERSPTQYKQAPHLNYSRTISSSTSANTKAVDPTSQKIVPGIILGEWVYDEKRIFAAPVCCGFDTMGANGTETSRKHFTYNPEQCGIHNIYFEHHRGRNDFYQQTVGHACICDDFSDVYVWKSPLLPNWNAAKTCRMLGNRTVMVVGDSTVQQAAATLMNSLFGFGCSTQISFFASDTLINESFGAWNRGTYWSIPVEKEKPDIVIVSVGAHVHRNFTYVIETFLSDVIKLRKKYPDMQFVWKTQQPGGCTSHISSTNRSFRQFNYDEFAIRDSFVISLLQRYDIPYLDLRMLYR